ncbi:oligosaccharide flippase family protein [Capnocytophaga sputigena]|jgi:O-antigen transporter|uniref:oligosaccharide flippase family protein n=1 Tax=Capnocytophaga sputigena TaxID=1019 RepID=UPI00248EC747|nr:oligosaccharide flippase family protein [Capnocytophaga sputigena]
MKERLKQSFLSNKKVIENYFFMTVILLLNSMFGLLIYPYLIKTLGTESYGIFLFATTIANYFICFVGFGFDMYGLRKIAENPSSIKNKSEVLSNVFTTKIYLEILSIIFFITLILLFPNLRENIWVYIICFTTTLVNIFFPTWYFQGIQKMRVVTYIQLLFKLLSLPFIFTFVRTPDDILVFSIIMTTSSLLGAFYAFIHLFIFEGIKIRIVAINRVKAYVVESQYFFYTNFLNIMKAQTLNLIVGIHFGMRDLAIYDLGAKIVQVPFLLTSSINGALFPKIVLNFNIQLLKKILFFERIVGVLCILSIVFFGKLAIKILGNDTMMDAYPIAVILSFTIFAFLQTGCYITLILIPKKKDIYVLKDLIISFVSLVIFILIGSLFSSNILILPISLSLSALIEILYLKTITKKIS